MFYCIFLLVHTFLSSCFPFFFQTFIFNDMFVRIQFSVFIPHSDQKESPVSTIIIRGSTENVMDDIERAVDDGVNTFKALTKVYFNL